MKEILIKNISIGDELLIGQVINTNAAWLGEHLSEAGFHLDSSLTIADSENAILNAFDACMDADLVLVTGGLGPTADDITKPTVCKFFDTELEFCQAAYDNVVALFGTASYIMRQYLERLSQKAFGKQCVFLMFYKPGYIPPYMEYEGACIPHFDYGVNEIVSMFRWCKISNYADYLVVTNMNIDWEWVAGLEPKKRASEPVQTSLF